MSYNWWHLRFENNMVSTSKVVSDRQESEVTLTTAYT